MVGKIQRTGKQYDESFDELIEDIGKAYREVIKQLYDAGCRTIQFDDCTWGAIVGDAAEQRYKLLGNLKEVKEQLGKCNCPILGVILNKNAQIVRKT